MEVNCWTWMWSCMAQHHSTLNRVGAPPQQSTVCCCRHLSLECSNMAWDGGQEQKCIHGKTSSSCPTLCPCLACIRITHSFHFALNWDEMKGERHPWQLWTCEPWLTSGQVRTVLCADASQPGHRILIKPFPMVRARCCSSMSSPWPTNWKMLPRALKTVDVVKKTNQKNSFLLFFTHFCVSWPV